MSDLRASQHKLTECILSQLLLIFIWLKLNVSNHRSRDAKRALFLLLYFQCQCVCFFYVSCEWVIKHECQRIKIDIWHVVLLYFIFLWSDQLVIKVLDDIITISYLWLFVERLMIIFCLLQRKEMRRTSGFNL